MNLAWKEAERLVALMPRDTQWSFTITEIVDDAVLNIYVYRTVWDAFAALLGLNEPIEEGSDYRTCYHGSLAVSLIEPEDEEDGNE